ncbi:MAG: SulP family inorganic anion transporter [Ruminococcus sp.]|nr:SulP family inorganic anion transporter [Ruminococcus sp.]
MKISVLTTLRGYKLKYLPNDIFAGLIVAAVSIPISMGYSQVCGMPAIYGLYGSVFPILIFALFSTSPQFIFGVDAAPCAIVGGVLATTLGISAGSEEAIRTVPLITLCAAIWLILFSIMKAGKLVNFISVPVMGGFISGIATTIILMQFPKLLGSTVGNGELIELIICIVNAFKEPNFISSALGAGTVIIIVAFKKIAPKFPMAIVAMILGAVATVVFHIEDYGVKLLEPVESGLPKITIPHIELLELSEIIGTSLTIAIVILAETLLSENNFAMKNGYKINDNREIFTFGVANFVSAFTGGLPMNGSVSRTSMAEQFGGKTQLMSVVAGGAMVGILLFGTGFISYLPVPVLTGIVISALLGVIEFDVAKRLIKNSKADAIIFFAAFFGVLLLGTIYGVLIGAMLSFVAVVRRAINPARSFRGVIEGKEGFFTLKRNRKALPIKGVVIYSFSGNLFFANINIFQEDIERNIKDDTKVVIIDGRAITHIDVTAADRIEIIYKQLSKKGIKFYITEHIGSVNDQLRKYGLGYLIDEGVVHRTIELALNDVGYTEPYMLDYDAKNDKIKCPADENNTLQEYEWAYGEMAEEKLNETVEKIIDIATGENAVERKDIYKEINLPIREHTIIEDDLLARLEERARDIAQASGKTETIILKEIEERREEIRKYIKNQSKQKYSELKEHRTEIKSRLEKEHPEIYQHINEILNKDKNIK